MDKSYCFSSFLLGLIFNILPSLGHLKTFSGHKLPLHFSITPCSAITRHDNFWEGLYVHIYVFCQTNKTSFEIDCFYGMLTYQYAPPPPNYAPPPNYCILLQPGLRLITMQNNFEIKRMMNHLVLKLCITIMYNKLCITIVNTKIF